MNEPIGGPSDAGEVTGEEPDTSPALPVIEPTGHAAIDEALAALSDLSKRPVTEHVATYDAIHHVVRTTLADAGRPEGSGTL